MITMTVESPEQLWCALGGIFLSAKRPHGLIDYGTNQRFFSLHNVLRVTNWPKYWDNHLMHDIVGYMNDSGGTKMTTIRGTYLNEVSWHDFKLALDEVKSSKIYHIGVNFNMVPRGKGGCLSSFHICKHDDEIDIVVHMKIAEVPKKFMADLSFISKLITELDLIQGEYRVTFMLSALYWSMVGLRAYIPIFGKDNLETHGLDLEAPIGIQQPTQAKMYRARNRFLKQFGEQIMDKGLSSQPWEVLIKKGRV